MDTLRLRTFAHEVRRELRHQVAAGIDLALTDNSRARNESAVAVEGLERLIAKTGKASVVDSIACFWFNRFCALRFMDVKGYVRVWIVSPRDKLAEPEILAWAKSGQFDSELTPPAAQVRVSELLSKTRSGANSEREAYRILLVAACRSFHRLLPSVFEPVADEIELLMPDALLAAESVLSKVVENLDEEACQDVEALGWLYQFYMSDRKDQVMSRRIAVPAEDIPAVTQLFTPHWIVRYLVDNSLGRLWLLHHPGSQLRQQMSCFIEEVASDQSLSDFCVKSDSCLKIERPEDIRVLDPACGSGHILTYAFDLLVFIYAEEGYSPAEIPSLILRHNLQGLEICSRAAQLARLVLLFKAREKSDRFFQPEQFVRPNIIELQNVNFTDNELPMSWLLDTEQWPEGEVAAEGDLLHDLHLFTNAKNFGSLLQPKLSECQLDFLRQRVADSWPLITDHLFSNSVREKVASILEQAMALTQRYHVVVANPPYMGHGAMNASLLAGVKVSFPQSKTDLGVVFVDRALTMTVSGGWIAMVNQHTWLFLGSYAEFRSRLLAATHIVTAAHLGPHAFPEISGEVVQSVAFVIRNARQDVRSHFVRLIDLLTTEEKERNLRNAARTFSVFQQTFLPLPGHIFGYWLSERTTKVLGTEKTIDDFAHVRRGLQTGNSPRFIRFWHETEAGKTLIEELPASECTMSHKRWFLFNNGGDFRKWHGNVNFVVNWASNGRDIKATGKAIIPSEHRYFEEGVTWSRLSGGRTAFRLLRKGIIPGDTGPTIFNDGDRRVMLAYLNTAVCETFLKALVPSMTFLTGDIGNLPFKVPEPDVTESIHSVVSECVSLASADWDNFETSCDFRDQPLLRPGLKGETLEASWRNWQAQRTASITRMQELETENNRIFISAYGLEGEVQPHVPEDQITLARAEPRRDMAAFVSYAVGCMFGRYSLDVPGIILADAGATVDNYVQKIHSHCRPGNSVRDSKLPDEGATGHNVPIAFLPVEDNVITILNVGWQSDDITDRFRKFLKATFGKMHFEENLHFLEKSAGRNVRKYFLNEFYKHHVQTYRKRPVYWLFSSPSGTFNALIYMHRYGPDTIGVVLGHLRDFQTKLQCHRRHVQAIADNVNAKKADRKKALKEMTQLMKDLHELDDYEHRVIRPLASRRIEIDLDDGVRHNYLLFGEALRKIPGLESKDQH